MAGGIPPNPIHSFSEWWPLGVRRPISFVTQGRAPAGPVRALLVDIGWRYDYAARSHFAFRGP